MRIARAIAAAGLTLGLAAGATAAHADPVDPDPYAETCHFTNPEVNPSSVTLGLSKEITVKVTATAIDCDAYPDGAPLGTDEGGHDGDIGPSTADPTHWVGTLLLDPQELRNVNATTGYLYVDLGNDGAGGLGDDVTLDADLGVLRNSRLDADAPSKVKKNKSFKVEGFLEKADWDENQYVSVDDWYVRVESKPKGGTWTELRMVTSGSGRQGGVLDFSTKIKKETCFRFVYEGLGHIAPVTEEAGCVKVKK